MIFTGFLLVNGYWAGFGVIDSFGVCMDLRRQRRSCDVVLEVVYIIKTLNLRLRVLKGGISSGVWECSHDLCLLGCALYAGSP